MLSKAKLQKIEKLRDDLADSGKDVPPHIGLIHPFPVEYFEDLQFGVESGDFRIQRFAYAMDPALLDLFGTTGARLRSTLGSVLFLGVPLVAVAAGFFLSWWWLALLPLAFVGMRWTKTAYDSSVLQAAANDEPSFCLLYWSGQVSVWDATAKKIYYRDSGTTFTWKAQRDREKSRRDEADDEDGTFQVRRAPTPPPPVDLEKARDYHSVLDEMVAECVGFLAKHKVEPPNDWPPELHAETIVYSACYVAKLRSRHKFSIAGWNTFKASVENRMLSIKRDEAPKPESDGFSLVSYTSSYYGYLKQRELLARPADEDNSELIEALADDVGADEGILASFGALFRQFVARANKDVLFKAWLVFEN